MKKENFIEELTWRNMIHTIMPGTEDQLKKEMTSGYVGIDPTADSLHIGHLVGVMMLKHMQVSGHKPFALIGGATGMIGDPSEKSKERILLTEDILLHNQKCIQHQLSKFLDFNSSHPNSAVLVNNYDWMKDFSFLDFSREIGKHITVNYMMAKESVKKRLGSESKSGMSFTEFTYQLLQGYDFLHLYKNHNLKLQMGGSDQWGNITTGTELINKISGGKGFALTCPLITKSDGSKFGKTESGNIWLDPKKTTPYTFYQFWLNTSDEDASQYIKIFTLFSKDEIDKLIEMHGEAPHKRLLQKTLAQDITIRVHSEKDFGDVLEASQILFGKGTTDILKKIDENTLLSVFAGVPQYNINKEAINWKIGIVDFLAVETNIFESKGAARRMLKDNGVSINKEKVKDGFEVSMSDLLNKKYILVQKGKNKYFIVYIK